MHCLMVFYPCLPSCLLISVLTAKITLTQAFVILIGLPVKLRKWHLQEIERFKKWFDSYSNSGVLPSEQVALLKHKIRNVPWLVVWSLINCFTVNIEWSWRPFAPSECGWAGRGLLALHPSGPREDSRPWPGHLAASDAHTFQHLGTLGCLTMPQSRPFMGAPTYNGSPQISTLLAESRSGRASVYLPLTLLAFSCCLPFMRRGRS